MKKTLFVAATLLALTACNRDQTAEQSATTDTTAVPAEAPATDTTATMPATDMSAGSTSADMTGTPMTGSDATTGATTDTMGTPPPGTDTGTGTIPPANTDTTQQNNGNTTPPTP